MRAADLRFNLDEAAALLRQVLADLDLSVAAALAERTEGWAVGLQLAALSLRTQPDVARFVAAFTGSHRYVLDYLTEEVLSRQRQDLRNFLLETSVLDRLSGRCVTRSPAAMTVINSSKRWTGPGRRWSGWVRSPISGTISTGPWTT